MIPTVLAIDIGATKAAIALVDKDLKILDRINVPTGQRIDIWPEIAKKTLNLITKNHATIEGAIS